MEPTFAAPEPLVRAHPAHRHARPRRGRSVVSALVGLVGELLITAGILILGFVAWQVWWSSDEAAAVATSQVSQFRAQIPDPVLATTPLTTTGTPPVMDKVAPGETFGVLIIPKWYDKTDNDMPIREGTTQAILDQAAAGHYVHTVMPGDIGNFSLAGHRRTHGNSFRYINVLERGDQIIVETKTTWYVYEVKSHEIVTPDQTQVVAPVPNDPDAAPTERYLTLTTCHSPTLGEWGNSHRWVVHAKLVGWLDRDKGTPEQILDHIEKAE
ncbi:class E sortase [Rarobacter incanus]|nr:class E sortase [Rarobacter incanus]